MATRSPLWNYFEIDKEEAKYAICLICKLKVSRGGEGKKAGTSCMKNHLKAKHPDKFSEIYGGSSSCVVPAISTSSTASTCTTASQPSLQKQLTLAETVERKQYWGINDSKSQEFHYLIGEMIALDNEPLSIVDRVGFNRLMQKAVPRYKLPSRTYMTEKIIPDIYDRIIKKIMEKILNAAAVSITSDIWTCDHNNESFLSFTAHWISPDFKLEHGVLAMKPFSGSHTGENIANELNIIAARWNIPFNKIHIIVHDSGANMVKGVQVAEYDSARCFIHSLQRVITESLKTQPDLVEMLNAARRIVTHFNHSALAQEKLKAIQKELKLPEHRLVQDISTRWNSTYYLQERLLEQRRAVSLYIADHNKLGNLTPQQWNLMEQCIILLKPFEEITKITSSGLSCISEVIPHVAVLMRYIQKEETSRKVPNLLQFLTSLKTQLQQRFEHLDENLKYFLATLLDPRFKTNFFGVIQAEKARQSLLLEGLKLSCGEEDASSSGGDSPPLKKRAGSSMSVHDSFWDCFNEVVKDNNQTEDSDNTAIANELDFYLKMVPLDRKSDPYAWWAANAKQFPILVKFAQIYLSSPCSSVYSERLFSEAGLVYENKRNRLLPKNAENLVFIHHNLPLVDFQY
ncbi:unnamed protein product [Spodoptera exigua]|nr:unnamed protein product [Spodoptera exigua]